MFNASFDGKFKPKKAINLGGQSKTGVPQTREQMLAIAAAERAQRALERQKIDAAIRIQAFHRLTKKLVQFKHVLREEFLQNNHVWLDAEPGVDRVDAFQLKYHHQPALLLRTLSTFLFFFHPQLDSITLRSWVTVLCMTAVKDGWQFGMTELNQTSLWTGQLSRVLLLGLKTDDASTWYHPLLDRTLFSAINNEILNSAQLVNVLLSRSLIKMLAQTAENEEALDSNDSKLCLTMMVSALSTSLNSGQLILSALDEFVSEVFSRPWSRSTAISVPLHLFQAICSRIRFYIAKIAEPEDFMPIVVNILGSLIAFYRASFFMTDGASEIGIQITYASAHLAFMDCVGFLTQFLYSKIEVAVLSPLADFMRIDDPEDEDDENISKATTKRHHFLRLCDSIQDQVEFMLSKAFLELLSTTATADTLIPLCAFFSTLMNFYAVDRVVFLDGFAAPFSLCVNVIKSSLSNLPENDYWESGWSAFPVLVFASHRVTVYISKSDIDELLNNRFYPWSEILVLATQTKNLVFKRIWAAHDEAVINEDVISSSDLVLIKFLSLLNDKNTDKRLFAESFWEGPFIEALGNNGGATFVQLRVTEERDERRGKCAFLLKALPFLVPFEIRVEMFRAYILLDRARMGLNCTWIAPATKANIRRSHIFEDAFDQLNHLHRTLKSRIAISFQSELGEVEAGVDGGGIFKEFLSMISTEIFNPDQHFFITTPEHLFYPAPEWSRPALNHPSKHWDRLAFVGRIIGKALYEGILLDVEFADVFLRKWLGKISFFDELASFDRDLYDGLLKLKRYPGDLKELYLFFCFDAGDSNNAPIALLPGGENMQVDRDNVVKYVYLLAHYRLNLAIMQECRSFFDGLTDLIDPKWIRMFSVPELSKLISGSSRPIDIDDLRRNTSYSDTYDDSHPTIQALWNVLGRLNAEDRRLFVRFVTSVERPPLLGFRELKPPFCIRQAGHDEERLPTASTCVNLLKLPPYKSEEMLERKLRYAIHQARDGFHLS